MSVLLGVAVVASYLPRVMAVRKFRQPVGSAVLHPLGILMLLGVQWYALVRQVLGRPVEWRARAYASVSGEEVEARERLDALFTGFPDVFVDLEAEAGGEAVG